MDILSMIGNAGVVGCGGAGFPTHLKLRGRFEWLIVNGAECEPLLWNDKYLMREKAPELVSTVVGLQRALSIPKAAIALKRHYHAETAALQGAVEAAGAGIEIRGLDGFYPAGDEQTLVYEVTGRVVPPAGLPGQVGAVVDNVATVLAIHDALEGVPLTRRLLTVTGEVNRPVIVDAPVGASFADCLRLAGGLRRADAYILSGGPMMGRPVPADRLDGTFVTKTTSGIIALPPDGPAAVRREIAPARMLARARSACIQCSYCTQLCPRHLLGHPLEPHRIMRRMAAGADPAAAAEDPILQTAQLCCECGVCEEYACPMGLNPRRINAMLKGELARAGFRFRYDGPACVPGPWRDMRKAPTERIAARAGLRDYADIEINDLVVAAPERVTIPLRMHIGRPSVPVVRVGDAVTAGDLIAEAAESGPGARIHASLTGRIAQIDDNITIERERV